MAERRWCGSGADAIRGVDAMREEAANALSEKVLNDIYTVGAVGQCLPELGLAIDQEL